MRRHLWNPLDLCLILIFLASVLGIFLRCRDRYGADDDALRTVEIVLWMQNVDAELVDVFTVGDRFCTMDGDLFGDLRQITSTPANVSLESGGIVYEGTWDDGRRVDVTLILHAEGAERENGWFIQGRTAVLKGQTVEARSDRAYVRALVRDIRRTEPENGKNESL